MDLHHLARAQDVLRRAPGAHRAPAQEAGMVEQDQALRGAAAGGQVTPGGVLREHDPPVPPVQGRHRPAHDLGQEDDDRARLRLHHRVHGQGRLVQGPQAGAALARRRPRRLLQQELGVGVGQAPLLRQVAVGPHPAVRRPVLAPDRGAGLLQGAPVGQGQLGALRVAGRLPQADVPLQEGRGIAGARGQGAEDHGRGAGHEGVVVQPPQLAEAPAGRVHPPLGGDHQHRPGPGLRLRPHQGPPEGRRPGRRRPAALRGRPPGDQ